MKKDIHPEYYPDAVVRCACGNSWTTGSTLKEVRTDVCSACHPFFTGEQRIVDSEGRVDRFYRRLRQAQAAQDGGKDGS
jgi:large subunit ribosomal protein L31